MELYSGGRILAIYLAVLTECRSVPDGRLVVQCFTSPPTQYRLYGGRTLTDGRTGAFAIWTNVYFVSQ